MPKYNILYTTSYNRMMGGGQWSLYYLIKHLNKDIFHPIVLCPEEGELADNMRSAGADMIFMDTGRISHLNPFVIKKLVSIIKERRIALIHTDSTTETFYAGISAKILGIPLIWHIRGSEEEWFLDWILALLSTKLILVANTLSSRFKWLKGGSKLSVIYNAVDIEEFDAFPSSYSLREEFKISKDMALIGCIGRIEERKGQKYLIDAMKGVDNVKLVFIGNGDVEYLKWIKDMCEKLNVSDRVIFGGYRDNIPALLKGIDILAFPTLTEAFSRVILEAMAAGKPVIATDVGGNREAVVDGVTGYIIPSKDTLVLADRINKLVSSREKREEMGKAGRMRLEEFFAIKNNVQAVEKLYKEIILKCISKNLKGVNNAGFLQKMV